MVPSVETIVEERDEPLSSLACHLTSQRDDSDPTRVLVRRRGSSTTQMTVSLCRTVPLSTCASPPIPETRIYRFVSDSLSRTTHTTCQARDVPRLLAPLFSLSPAAIKCEKKFQQRPRQSGRGQRGKEGKTLFMTNVDEESFSGLRTPPPPPLPLSLAV